MSLSVSNIQTPFWGGLGDKIVTIVQDKVKQLISVNF